MAVCVRCHTDISFWAGGVNKQTGLCRNCTQQVRMEAITNIRNGNLPTVRASIHLETDEICHLEMLVAYIKPATKTKPATKVPGRFIATSRRLHFLASTNSFTITWSNVLRAVSTKDGVYIELTRQGGTGHYTVSDGEYVAAVLDTLTRMAKRQIVPTGGKSVPREIPQDVKAAVWQRDGGRCKQCGAQEYLEFDHIIPFSRGGASTVNNLQLLCRRCNQKKGAHI